MDQSPNLKLAYIAAAQAQKHVTHNEALRVLDAVVQLSVIDRDLSAPPGSPANGDRYIVALSATGAWTGHDGEIAAFQDGAWVFYAPLEGWIAWVAADDELVVWDGTAWIPTGGGGTNPVDLVGINATADATNRLSVSAPATLLNHEGNGHQLKINKNAESDTATVLYQTGFSGRAETGLAGDDDYHFKVSANGADWTEALVIDKDTGAVSFPAATVGVGVAAPAAAVDVDASGKEIPGLRLKTDLNEDVFQHVKPDGNNLLRGMWDGGFYHHYLGASIIYNLGNFNIHFESPGTGRLLVSRVAIDGAASLLTSQGLRIGEDSYATAGVPNTTPQIVVKSYAWNDSNGHSVGTPVALRLSQLSATDDDARWGVVRISDAQELFSLLVSDGNVGIGRTTPTAKLDVNGAARIGTFTVASLPSASGTGAGAIVYVSDESGGAVLAFSDGTNWRRVTDRAVVS